MKSLDEEQHVDSKETFIRFMDALRQDWEKNHELIRRGYGADTKMTGIPWKNCYLPDFLEAMQNWFADSKQLPSDFPYREFARILAATTSYQSSEVKSKGQRFQRLNCWEFKNCGREIGGRKVAEFGICSATVFKNNRNLNNGNNGGRVCWELAGTFCGGKVQGTFAEKVGNCLKCDFYLIVREQEGKNFQYAPR